MHYDSCAITCLSIRGALGIGVQVVPELVFALDFCRPFGMLSERFSMLNRYEIRSAKVGVLQRKQAGTGYLCSVRCHQRCW